MVDEQASVRILAWIFTFVGVAVVWMAIVSSLPSQQELSAKQSSQLPQAVSAATEKTLSEPTLDLSIPGVPAAPLLPSSVTQETAPSTAARLDRHAVQAARLRCEAEAEQLCPGSSEGLAHSRCLERRMHQLAASCQVQLRERFVKWKEERSRLTAACEMDMKRFCSSVKPSGGRVLQCLQVHAPDLSDRCYQTLPKGTVSFKQ